MSSIRKRWRSARWKHRRSGLAMFAVLRGLGPVGGPGVASASWMAILHDKVHIARAVNAAEAIPLEDAPRGYAELDSGAATKYVLNPDGYVAA